MKIALIHNWWSLVLRGVLGVILGIVTFASPGITLAGIVILFGAYALLDGVFSVMGAVRAARDHEQWGVLVIEGIVGIGAAIVTMAWPAITVIALVYVIGAWAVITGVLELAAAIRLRRHITGEWMLALGGIASLIFGIMMMLAPLAGALVIALWVGAYAFVFGIVLIALGLRLRGLRNRLPSGPAIHAPAH